MGKKQSRKAAGDRQAEPQGQPPAAAGDAPPSNTASNTCNRQFFKPLRWGVDSLYLSYPGQLSEAVEEELELLKGQAQSVEPGLQALAQFPIEDHIFEVKDKGAGLFPYVLEDNAFRICLSRHKAKSLPMAYIKLSSDYLASVSPKAAEERLCALLRGVGELSAIANVSRVDLFVDFVTDFDLEGWDRHAWVTRASQINSYSVDGRFSGWTVGLGGPLSMRLYDKTLEIRIKGHKDVLKALWRMAGWDLEQRVWRLEIQFRREVLSQKGVPQFPQVMDNLNGLWSYAITEWLRLTLPNPDDNTRSRWPLHPLWGCVSAIDFGSRGGPLSPRFSPTRAPDDDYLFTRGLSGIVSFMARDGITDFEAGVKAYVSQLRHYHLDLCFDVIGMPFEDYIHEKVALKARQYNTMVNSAPESMEGTGLSTDAEAYRRLSNGE